MTDRQTQSQSYGLPVRAIIITLLACGAFVALTGIRLPGLRAAVVDASRLNVAMLALKPILAAFILTELVAALVPGLRALRHTTEGRVRLRQTSFLLAFAIATLQIVGVVRYAQAAHLLDEGSLFRRPIMDPSFALAGALLLGVAAVAALAWMVDRAGVGVGYSVLIAAGLASSLVEGTRRALQQAEGDLFSSLFMSFFVLGVFALASLRMLRSRPLEGSSARYRLPTPGIEPVHQAVGIAVLALNSGLAQAFFWPLVPALIQPSWVHKGLQLMLTASLCRLLSNLFHRPATEEDRAALAKAARASTLWLCGLTVGSWYVDQVFETANGASIDSLSLIALIAVGMDLARELRAYSSSGPQQVLRVVHRLEDADSLSAALQAGGIATALRGAHHRALFQFFAPFIPIGVLVARADAERAEIIAAEYERALAEPPALPVTPDEGILAPG